MRAESDVEVHRLRELLRELVALSDIPGVWLERAATGGGAGTEAVASALADALVGLLGLDFAFVRLGDPGGAGTVDVTRGDGWKDFPQWLQSRLPLTRREIVEAGDAPGACRGFATPIGRNGEAGVLAAACGRAGFPTATELLLLSLAANQAGTAFQSARLVRERIAAEAALREARDELERQVAQRTAELRRSEAYLAEAQRLTHTGSFAIDVPTREITHSSAEHTRLYGFDPADGMPSIAALLERIDPDDRVRCVAAVEAGVRDAANVEVEYRVLLPSGEIRWHRAIAHPVVAPSGESGEFVGTIVDVTERREAEAELERLADEQAALRRVATLVAKEAPPAEVLAKVAEELASLLGDAECSLFRDEGDGTATLVALSGTPLTAGGRVGVRYPVEGNGVIASVLRERRPRRIDDYGEVRGAIAEHGRRSAVGCPIVVRGRVWGAIGAARREPLAFPAATESRLARFAELAATAVANAQARGEVERLAAEQAALRRVATLVAQGAPPPAVFDAVAAETAALLEADGVTVCRYEPGGELTVVAHRAPNAGMLPPGTRIRHDAESLTAIVRRTERPARMDSYADTHGRIGAVIEGLRYRSGVGAPIVVDGRLWGVTIASWAGEEPPPAGTEERMAQFAELLDTAIANADGRDQLMASRARLVAEADEARRRVVRDLHDGAQQRLVHTILTLKLALRGFGGHGADVEALVREALENAERSNEELRELAHGILPTVLAHGGLRAGVGEVVAQLDLPVVVDVPAARFTEEIEASAYFVVAEALTNVVKHSRARCAEVRASVADEVLHVDVRDDGVGGADPHGHGLVGLGDRVTALGGRLQVESPPGGGTLVSATLPLSV